MGSKCSKSLPPPYSVEHPSKCKDMTNTAVYDASSYDQATASVAAKAFHDALSAYADCNDIESTDAAVQHKRHTVRIMSELVYGRPLGWMHVPAFVHTARRAALDGESLVLSSAMAEFFLEG